MRTQRRYGETTLEAIARGGRSDKPRYAVHFPHEAAVSWWLDQTRATFLERAAVEVIRMQRSRFGRTLTSTVLV